MMLIPRNDIYDWFDDFVGERNFPRQNNNWMKTDIKEVGENYQLEIDVPGFKKEDLKVELDNGYLTVSACNQTENEENENNRYIHRERTYGKCSRNFYVGNNVNQDQVKANFKDGTLFISYPKNSEKDNEKKFIDIQ